MIRLDFYKGKPVGVLGLGATGLSVARAFLAGGAEVIGWDDGKETRKKALRAIPELRLLPPEASDWRGLAIFVPSPGISEKHSLIQDLTLLKIPITGDVELFARALKGSGARVVAITGTNGKSTAVALTAHLLKQEGFSVALGGNIGTPVLALDKPDKDLIYVLEVSSYQADRLESFAPTIAVQLNLTPDHTQRHGSLEKYAAAKAKIFAHLTKNSLALINTKDEFGKKLFASIQSNKIELSKINLPPKLDIKPYHKDTIAASYEIARYFGISARNFSAALASFKPLAHRQALIAEINGIAFINDSKATNAEAARLALERYQNIHWLAGGAAKAEGFASLAASLDKVNHAYLFGSAADSLSKFLNGKISYSKYKTLEDATASAMKNAKKGVVLLSPACASFDAYRDFAARGAAFAACVRSLSAPKVIIASGGTGGGIFPAEGLAHSLRARGKQTHLFYDKRAKPYIQRSLWDGARQIASAPVAARSVLGIVAASFVIAYGLAQSLYCLARIRGQKIVVGFGGYPCVPVVLAAALLRIPIVLHEPGAVVGRANRALLPFAKKISLSQALKKNVKKSVVIGNPVRPQLQEALNQPYALPKKNQPLRILVFAGSQGATWFDENIAPALSLLAERYKLSVVQQVRSREKQIKKLYDKAAIAYTLAPFFNDIEKHIAASHLVIARGGASTISELRLLSRPAIIIPHSGAAPRAEQQANAQTLVDAGLGWIVSEQEFSPETLAQKITDVIETPKALAAVGQESARNDAADKLAELVLSEAKNV